MEGSLAKQTFYTVWRRAGTTGGFTQIGSVAAKRFIDQTVPGGVGSVSYYLRAQRGNAVSAPGGEVTVNFGSADMAEAA